MMYSPGDARRSNMASITSFITSASRDLHHQSTVSHKLSKSASMYSFDKCYMYVEALTNPEGTIQKKMK